MLLATLTILVFWNVGLLVVISRFRIDSRPSGSSADGCSHVAEFNVLNPKNYSRRGRQLLPLLVVSQVLLLVVVLIAAFS